MNFKLPTSIESPQQLEAAIYEIAQYLDWYRQAEVQRRVGAKLDPEPTRSDTTGEVLAAWLQGREHTVAVIEELETHLKGLRLPVVDITLAAWPTPSQRAILVKWFRTNTRPDVLVSFVADRTLGGGILVRTPNRVFDGTWQQLLADGRAHIPEIIHGLR